jgi:hypothetical protein
MKKKELTLQDIFNQNNELYKNLVDCITRLEEKIDNSKSKTVEPYQPAEIPNTEYITITADDVYVGGESATQYNGQDIYNRYFCPAYFKEARDIIRKENGCELLEIHCLQSSTNGEYAESGNPIPDKDGKFCWVRIKFKDKDGTPAASLWVFYYSYSSASACAYRCASACGDGVRFYSVMRSGLFGSVRK